MAVVDHSGKEPAAGAAGADAQYYCCAGADGVAAKVVFEQEEVVAEVGEESH
jgi:hypothetical protein